MLAEDSYFLGVPKVHQSAAAKTNPATNKNTFRWRKNISTMVKSERSELAEGGAKRACRVIWSVITEITLWDVRGYALRLG
jgi:hypothetical protein